MIRQIITTALLVALALAQAPPVAAASPSAFDVLSSLQPELFAAAFPAGAPMSRGLVGANRKQWVGAGEQVGGFLPIINGAVRDDVITLDRYFKVIDVTFEHQRPDGSFDYPPTLNGQVMGEPAQVTGAAFFLSQSSMALMIVRQSRFGSRYAHRIDALVPKYRLSLAWLAQPRQVQTVSYADRLTTNRLFFDAAALYLGAQFAGMPEITPPADTLLRQGLADQNPAGYFAEHNGPDTSYNAVSCLVLAEMELFAANPVIRGALSRSVAWEMSRIHPDGQIDEGGNTRTGAAKLTPAGTPYAVDYGSALRMFAIVGAETKDAAAIEAARRISAFHKANPSY